MDVLADWLTGAETPVSRQANPELRAIAKAAHSDSITAGDWSTYDPAGRTRVWHHPTDPRQVISFRGTYDARDMTTDAMLARGMLDPERFQAAVDFVAARGNRSTVVTGHSLGGTIALYVAHRLPWVEAVAWYPYVSTPLRGQIDYAPNQTVVIGNREPGVPRDMGHPHRLPGPHPRPVGRRGRAVEHVPGGVRPDRPRALNPPFFSRGHQT